ncbi:Elongation factor 1-alpha-B/C [Lachnellula arida]|uniref:Elongation factor 1-alpha-B/C n=1 Tax=Lachnellula arida TaxID=1316785 RepID=A0A8T9BCS4_9HELO|nr:Elongation factor 1-alpha-B/C [Lachnellula arida]
MSSRDRTLVVVGPPSVGKATIEGRMLFEYGAIDLMTMGKLEVSVQKYDQMGMQQKQTAQSMCRDAFGWSEEEFKTAVKAFTAYLKNNGIDVAKIPIIPVSAIHGDNVVELSSNSSWYQGWVKEFYGELKRGTTLLEALDMSFEV